MPRFRIVRRPDPDNIRESFVYDVQQLDLDPLLSVETDEVITEYWGCLELASFGNLKNAEEYVAKMLEMEEGGGFIVGEYN